MMSVAGFRQESAIVTLSSGGLWKLRDRVRDLSERALHLFLNHTTNVGLRVVIC